MPGTSTKRVVWVVLLAAACGAQESGTANGRAGGTTAGTSGGFDNAAPTPANFQNPGTSGPAEPASTAPGDGHFGGKTCASAMVNPKRVRPTVELVIDGSGSMDEDFGGQSRWNALRAALMDVPGGVVPQLESVVDFGMAIYDGPDPAGNIFAMLMGQIPPNCAHVTDVPPAPMNFLAINAMYWSAPQGGSTPTQTALAQVVARMPDQPTVDADPNLGEQYIVLATDGAPNEFCGGPPDAQAEVLRVTNEAVAKGIQVFVISLAGGDAQLQTHLDQVAAAGDTGHPPFTPMNRDELTATLRTILSEAISCEIALDGTVQTGGECQGFVAIDGMDLPCDDPNGWMLKNESTVEIVGTACEVLRDRTEAVVEAGFPCGVFAPF